MTEADATVLIELTRGEATSLVGIIQLEKGRVRNRGDDRTADALGNIQDRLIKACDREEGKE